MSVIGFAARKAEREPHSEGTRVCLGCRHEWQGIAPIACNVGLECPACGMPKGVTKFAYGPDVGSYAFLCNCGCEALFAMRRPDGRTYIRCMACGEDHTNAIFG